MDQILGGINKNDVIKFQFRILLGSYGYEIFEEAKKDKDKIIVACLRAAWADAFRHTTKNAPDWDETKDESEKNDAIRSLLGNETVLEVFKKYAAAEGTKDIGVIKDIKDIKGLNYKVAVLYDAAGDLVNKFKNIKESKDGNPLSFGHFQKLFNMALKYYFCLYMFREDLGISALMEMYKFDNADCPIDSNVLKIIDKDISEKSKDKNNEEWILKCKEELKKYSKRKFSTIVWSKLCIDKDKDIDIELYIFIQKVISELLKDKPSKSNLYFDFENWE